MKAPDDKSDRGLGWFRVSLCMVRLKLKDWVFRVQNWVWAFEVVGSLGFENSEHLDIAGAKHYDLF